MVEGRAVKGHSLSSHPWEVGLLGQDDEKDKGQPMDGQEGWGPGMSKSKSKPA